LTSYGTLLYPPCLKSLQSHSPKYASFRNLFSLFALWPALHC
jgi:hypothetical protein